MAKRRKTSKRRYTRKTPTTRKTLPKQRLRLSKPYKPKRTYLATPVPLRTSQRTQRRTSAKKQPKKQKPNLLRATVIKQLTPTTEKLHTCIKRGQRKEIIHATNKAGRSGQRKPKWTKESRTKC